MADILIDNEAAPSTPAASKSVLWVDSTTKKFVQTDDSGVRHGSPISKNYSTASSAATYATDIYIASSSILIPSYGMEAGQFYRWTIGMSKTGAGTATPIVTVRTGSLQSASDTSRIVLTGTAATATASGGHMIVTVLVRSVSASGVLVGALGFTNSLFGGGASAVASTFDNSAMQGLYIDLSFNAGASAAYTVDSVFAELTS